MRSLGPRSCDLALPFCFLALACSGSLGAQGGSGPYRDGIVVIGDVFGPPEIVAEALHGLEEAREEIQPEDTPGLACASPLDCSPERPFCLLPEGRCVECLLDTNCVGSQKVCINNECVEKVCEPFSRKCVGAKLHICDATGTSLAVEDCANKGLPCLDDNCGPCEPGKAKCEGNLSLVCAPDGLSYEVTDCGEGLCMEGRCLACAPGMTACDGNNVLKCLEDGSAWEVVQQCNPTYDGLVCQNGACVSLCEKVAGERSNEGCEYWPLDLDQNFEYDAENTQFAVIVSNTSTDYDALVRVERSTGLEKEVLVPKGDLAIILLDPFNISAPGIATLGRRLKSTVPIVAYQFNPLENVGVYSNDASMLLPINVLGKQYRVLTWKARQSDLQAYFTVVAVEEGTTDVHIRVTAATQGGPGLPALLPGGEATVSLERFQTLHVKTTTACADLSGSFIETSRAVAVMVGHECANVPVGPSCSGEYCCCDHLEEQLPPLRAWGKYYAIGRTWPRFLAPDYARVIAAEDGTTITVQGAPVNIPTLSAGQVFEFEFSTDIVLSSDKPFLVSQFLAGQTAPTGCLTTCDDTLFFGKKCGGDLFGKTCTTDQDCCPGIAGIGDPAMIIAVPIEQFRKDYVFLVPTKYAENFVNIIAPAGAMVELDGLQIPQSSFSPFPGGQLSVARLKIAEGTHRVSSTHKIGIVVYGWDQYVSYGYAGGAAVNMLF